MEIPASPCVVLDPTGRTPLSKVSAQPVASRPKVLDGAVVGLLANGIPGSVELLDAVYTELGQRYELAPPLKFKKLGVSIPPTPEVMERLVSQATVAVVGTGI